MSAEERISEGILVVDDSPDDHEAWRRVASSIEAFPAITFVQTGEQALDFLREASTRGELPALMILDLDLPGISGHETLARLKADPSLGHLNVVVLSSSRRQGDVDECYAAGAQGYVAKPISHDRLRSIAQVLLDYWMKTVLLARRLK